MSILDAINTGTGSKLTALVAQGNIPNGTRYFIKTVRDYFRYDVASTLTADSITIIAPTTGSGKWIREGIPAQAWQKQTTWYVDSSAGSDENTGVDSGHPIKTIMELRRRTGSILFGPAVTVNIVSDITSGDNFIDDFQMPSGAACTLTWLGTRTSVSTGTVTAVQNFNAATNQDIEITDAGQTWTSQIVAGRQLVMTSGAANGAACWILKQISSGVARTSAFGPAGVFWTTPTAPATGTYRIDKLTNILVNGALQPAGGFRVYQNLRFGDGVTTLQDINPVSNLGPSFQDCTVQGFEGGGKLAVPISFSNCQFTTSGFFGGFFNIYGGCFVLPSAGAWEFEQGFTQIQDLTVQGISIFCHHGGHVRCQNGFFAIWDSTSHGIEVDVGGFLELGASGLLFGSGNTSFGMNVGAQCWVFYNVKPTITGTSGNFQMGITAFPWASTPITSLEFQSSIILHP